jgi:hypothetical protein
VITNSAVFWVVDPCSSEESPKFRLHISPLSSGSNSKRSKNIKRSKWQAEM